jgi:hypothetical protein
VRHLRATIKASMPRVRIEDLLQDVDEWCGFTRAFQPLSGYEPHGADISRPLLAAVIAHGTNLGLAAMAQSVDALTADRLQDISRWFVRDATLKAANTILVDYHHGLPLSRVWGDGSRSSSDGQRFAVERDSLLGAFYPRYLVITSGRSRSIPTPPTNTASTARRRSPARRARPTTSSTASWRTIPF